MPRYKAKGVARTKKIEEKQASRADKTRQGRREVQSSNFSRTGKSVYIIEISLANVGNKIMKQKFPRLQSLSIEVYKTWSMLECSTTYIENCI